MMAVYTIYEPQRDPCPIEFTAGDFWSSPGKFFVTVRNVGPQPILKMEVAYDHLMAPQYRRRPFNDQWSWPGPIEPGQEKSFEVPGYLPGHAEEISGWALFPKSVTDRDSTWRPKEDGQCFKVFWRDKEHPQPVVLPPLQMETRED